MNKKGQQQLRKKLLEVCLLQSHSSNGSEKNITYNYEAFQIYEFLHEHQSIESKSNVKFTCLKCGKSFSRFYTLKEHSVSTHEPGVPKKFVCSHCDKKFAFQKYLNRHKKNNCSKLREVENKKQEEIKVTIETDNQESSSIDPEICEYEDEILDILENKDCDNDTEDSIFEPSITLECDIEATEDTEDLPMHNNVLPFELGLADCLMDSFAGSEDEAADYDHSKSPEGDTDETFACHVCCAEFKSLRDLTLHLKKDHPDAKYVCEPCGKKFPSPSKYHRHMRTHSKPYKCSKCPARFSENSRCVKHLAQHDEEESSIKSYLQRIKC